MWRLQQATLHYDEIQNLHVARATEEVTWLVGFAHSRTRSHWGWL